MAILASFIPEKELNAAFGYGRFAIVLHWAEALARSLRALYGAFTTVADNTLRNHARTAVF